MWGTMVWLCRLPIIVLFGSLRFNIPFGIAFAYILYYILLDPIAGVSQRN